MEYNELLNKLHKEVKHVDNSERFIIPKVKGHVEGNKTIIVNFTQICSILRREAKHLAKFLFKELATPGIIEGNKLILNRKLGSQYINGKIEEYIKEFVICPECKKPDTEIIKEERLQFLHCLACGAKHSIRTKI